MYFSDDKKLKIEVIGDNYVFTFANGYSETYQIEKIGVIDNSRTPVVNLHTFFNPKDSETYYCFHSDGHIEKKQILRCNKDWLDPKVFEFYEELKKQRPHIRFVVTKIGKHLSGPLGLSDSPSAEVIAECVTEREAEKAANRFGDLCIVLNLETYDFCERWSNR